MNRIKLLLLSVIAIAFFSGCAGAKQVNISLMDLDPSLTKFVNDTIYDNVTNKSAYDTYGLEKYDAIFKEVAYTRATTSQLRFSLERVLGDSVRFPPNEKSLKFGKSMVKMAKNQVPQMADRVKTIVESTMALNPKSDFKGKDLMKAPAVALSLKGALSTMATAGNDIKEIGRLLISIKDKIDISGVSDVSQSSEDENVSSKQTPEPIAQSPEPQAAPPVAHVVDVAKADGVQPPPMSAPSGEPAALPSAGQKSDWSGAWVLAFVTLIFVVGR